MTELKPEMNVRLKPWVTPNFVVVDLPDGSACHVRDVDPRVLSAMCDRFRVDVFEKAGKADPNG